MIIISGSADECPFFFALIWILEVKPIPITSNIALAKVYGRNIMKSKLAGCLFLCFFALTSTMVSAGDLAVNGMVSGIIIEKPNVVIVEGATFVLTGNSGPAIKIDGRIPKKVIISNVRVLSNNSRQNDHTGSAGLVVVENSRSSSSVMMRDVSILARNTTIQSQSTASDVCAGLICNNSGVFDSAKDVSATAMGTTNITATQGTRPDYRKK